MLDGSSELLPEEYYFNEQGLMVFTRTYHLKRGYCCSSHCMHCPYDELAEEEE